MSVASKWIDQNLVFYDEGQPQRLYDAWGPGVCKVIEEFSCVPIVSGALAAWTTNDAGTNTVALTGGATGGALLITTGATDTNGPNLQLQGEAFKLASGKELYFGINFSISHATDSAFVVGLCITDTELVGGMTDGVYFRKVDDTTAAYFVLEKATAETATSAFTAVASTEYTLEFYFDGVYVDWFVNGVKGTQPATTNLTDEYLTPSIQFVTGSNDSRTMTVNWMRCVQIGT